MTTSAQELKRFSDILAARRPENMRVVDCLAEVLGFSDENADLQAANFLAHLVRKVSHDLEKTSLDEAVKAHHRRQLAPFQGLANLSGAYSTIEQAKKAYLAVNARTDLINIHSALSGLSEAPALVADVDELVARFTDIQKQIPNTELPDDLKRAIFKRTQQISACLQNFSAFGPEQLKEQLDALLGAVIVATPEKAERTKGIVKDILSAVGAAYIALQTLDTGLASVASIAENSQKLIELRHEVFPEDTPNR